jgi:hypothetical protein
MNLTSAIKLASENGYDCKFGTEDTEYPYYQDGYGISVNDILLDAKFWQALGKGMGWGQNDHFFENRTYDYWQLMWHRFIDHLASRGTIESFFSELK